MKNVLRDEKTKTPYTCYGCLWLEGGKCFEEKVAGPVPTDPESAWGRRLGHDISDEHSERCSKTRARHSKMKAYYLMFGGEIDAYGNPITRTPIETFVQELKTDPEKE